jgi:plastocyanin
MKRQYLPLVTGAIIAVISITALLITTSGNDQVAAASCHGSTKPTTVTIMIKNNTISPVTAEANLCDTLKFINLDPTVREIGFGGHTDYVPYNGVTERQLTQGQSFNVVLNQAGTYHFHDHLHEIVDGYFIVSK